MVCIFHHSKLYFNRNYVSDDYLSIYSLKHIPYSAIKLFTKIYTFE